MPERSRSQSQSPVSRRERPRKPALTRDGIVGTAVALTRSEGLEKVTMRRLAQELDTGPASLYVYVRNTAELHGAVLDELLGAVDVPAGSGWQTRMVACLSSYTAVLFEHPALARSALVTRPSGPHFLRLLETLLALLAEGGVPAGQAAWGVDVLLLHATAIAAEQATRQAAFDAQEEERSQAAAISAADPVQLPHLAALANELFSGTPQDRFAWSLTALIAGIAQTTRPTA